MISILTGETKDSFTEDVRARYEAYGWNTEFVQDGTDIEAINAAIESAKASGKPSLIEVKTVIGHGAPNKQRNQRCSRCSSWTR